jgi:hypothetical protein
MLKALADIEFIKWAVPLIGAVIAWLINERQKRALVRWELKRQACLEALEIVDAHFSNVVWTGISDTSRQAPPTVAKARDVYNKLCLSCQSDAVLKAYKKCLGIYGTFAADEIVDLRNAIRKELGFGEAVDADREKAWIAKLPEPSSSASELAEAGRAAASD